MSACAGALAPLLADGGWHASSDVKDALAAAGWSSREVQRAAAELGVEIRRVGFPSVTEWRRAGSAEPDLQSRQIEEAVGEAVRPPHPLDVDALAARWRVSVEVAAEFVAAFVEGGLAVVEGGRLRATPKGERLVRDMAWVYPQEEAS